MKERENRSIIIVAIVSLMLILLGWAYSGHIEAQTFNRMTGNDMTTWEAMWVNARIDCN